VEEIGGLTVRSVRCLEYEAAYIIDGYQHSMGVCVEITPHSTSREILTPITTRNGISNPQQADLSRSNLCVGSIHGGDLLHGSRALPGWQILRMLLHYARYRSVSP
jgi:hypothetical protein